MKGKDILLYLVLLLTMYGPDSALAQEFKRKMSLLFPEQNHLLETNTAATLSLIDCVGKLDDKLQKHTDNTALTRTGNILAMTYMDFMIDYWSHETAHWRRFSADGMTNSIKVDWSGFKEGFLYPNITFPVRILPYNELPSIADGFMQNANGLNQQEHNAMVAHRGETITFDQGIAALANKFSDIAYLTSEPTRTDNISPNRAFRAYMQGNDIVYLNEVPVNVEDDIEVILAISKRLGLRPDSRSKLMKRLLAADLLSTSTWDNVNAIYRYVWYGSRQTRTLTLNMGDYKITPPHIATFFYVNEKDGIATSGGILYHVEMGINNVTVRYEHNPDNNDRGIGLQQDDINIGKTVTLSPYVHVGRFDGRAGHKVGAIVKKIIGDNISLEINWSHSNNDFISTLNTADSGLNASLSMSWRF